MKDQAVQKSEVRFDMTLDTLDQQIEGLLGYSIQFVNTPNRCTWLVIFADGREPQPCDYGHQKTYQKVRQLVNDLNRIRALYAGIHPSDLAVAEKQTLAIVQQALVESR